MKKDKLDRLISSSLTGSWEQPAAVDLSIASPFCHENIQVACVMTGSAALRAEKRKHNTNEEKCRELGWVSIPLVVVLGNRNTAFLF